MDRFTVIAHRGASGYLPEHTLAGVAAAHAMGADYIEQDVVLTRDGELIVLHDLSLDAVTDVAERFPGRNRADGRHYAIDFDLAEIRSLAVHERVNARGEPVYPDRFPVDTALFRVPTLEEEIRLIQGLNRATGRRVGIYVEPKAPTWHRAQGQDLMAAVLAMLKKQGYEHRGDAACLQSFEPAALRRAREELGTELQVVQLIGENSWAESDVDFEAMRRREGLRAVAEYADGIGPRISHLLADGSSDISELAKRARQLGLFIHAYTLRADALPGGRSVESLLQQLIETGGADGVFTDHPDRVLRALRKLSAR